MAKGKHAKRKVIVEIKRGAVTRVASDANLEVVVLDYDLFRFADKEDLGKLANLESIELMPHIERGKSGKGLIQEFVDKALGLRSRDVNNTVLVDSEEEDGDEEDSVMDEGIFSVATVAGEEA